MTFVDDNLLAASPVRSGKAGANATGKSHDMDAANQKAAFESAFADVGKKKQPAIADDLPSKPDSTAEKLTASAKESDIDLLASDAEGKALPLLQDLATESDGFMKSSFGSSSTADAHPLGKTIPAQGSLAAAKGDHAQKFSLMQASLAGIGEDAGKTIDGPIGEKIASLLKNAEAGATVAGDKTAKSDDAPAANPQNEAMDAVTGDVSQLLSLLDAAQKPVVANQSTGAEATRGMSEFQALAERAGKAKPAGKDAVKAEAQMAGDANAVKNATEAGTDQVFRFARADGKGQAVSMSLASDGDRTVAKNDVPAVTAKAENVTVLEARRYLGLAPSSNAAAVTNQIAGNPEWARALQPGGTGAETPLTQASTGKVLNTLKIQMHPIDLGMVTATLRLKDDELQVEIKVETGDAFRQLSDDQSAMVRALRAQGFAVDQVNIVFNASDTSSSNNAQQQAQPQAGQQGREAAGDGSRGQRNDNGGQEQGRGRWTGNEGTGDASSGAELNRTGDVYM